MDTQQLQAFEQIVRHGTFSKAARSLDLAQPTITLRMQALEKEVGGRLFVRSGSRMELTEMGRSFLPYARQALSTLQAGVETARLVTQGQRGRVMIGTLPTLATGFFASVLATLHTTHPQLELIVHTGHNQQIVEMLYDGFIKVGLLNVPIFSTDFTVLHHIKESLIPVASSQHPLAKQGEISLAELRHTANPFLQIDWSMEMRRWNAQFLTDDSPLVEVPPQTAHDLLRRGIGATLLTRSFVADDIAAGRLVELQVPELPLLQRESALICLGSEEKLTPAVQAFVAALREATSN